MEPVFEQREQRAGRERPQAWSGQLDRQGQPIEPLADRHQGRGVRFSERYTGIHLP